jgi:hypothetical protein
MTTKMTCGKCLIMQPTTFGQKCGISAKYVDTMDKCHCNFLRRDRLMKQLAIGVIADDEKKQLHAYEEMRHEPKYLRGASMESIGVIFDKDKVKANAEIRIETARQLYERMERLEKRVSGLELVCFDHGKKPVPILDRNGTQLRMRDTFTEIHREQRFGEIVGFKWYDNMEQPTLNVQYKDGQFARIKPYEVVLWKRGEAK